MKSPNLSTSNAPREEALSTWKTFEADREIVHTSYHELADQPIVELDMASQLKTNLGLLEELQNRLCFVMSEVRYLMKM